VSGAIWMLDSKHVSEKVVDIFFWAFLVPLKYAKALRNKKQ
jgi:hypothetical protein